MRRVTLSLTVMALLAAGASSVAAAGLDVRFGGFFPRGRDCGVPSTQGVPGSTQAVGYTLFQDVCELFVPSGGSLDDFEWIREFDGFYGGVEFNHVLTDYVEVGVHYDYYSRTVNTSYRDYTRPDETEIRQSLRLRQAPLGVSVRLLPTSKRVKIAPFVGGGVDAVFYKYEEYGDFIDFFDPNLPVIADAFYADGVAFGWHALGGLRVYLNRDFAIVGEGRYQWAKDDMGDDFSPNEPGLVNRIDLSGWTFTVGLHVRF